jgi:prevent-host-death family protein
MNLTVTSSELKRRFGVYLRAVREGATLRVTRHGKPVAEIGPVRQSENRLQERLEQLAAEGWIRLPTRVGPIDFEPVTLRGRPISETLLEDREDRF